MVVAKKVKKINANCEIVINYREQHNCAHNVKMNSIIVLDSDSDLEDEAPSKKMRISRSIPATITAIKTGKTATTTTNASSTTTNTKPLAKIRVIPTGITITKQIAPQTGPATADTTKVQQSSTGVCKRKTPTPPHRSSATTTLTMPSHDVCNIGGGKSSSSSSRDNNVASSVGPLITTVQSMTASTTPPLQLLATPPPQTAGTSFNDPPSMLHTQMLQTNLPESTTITLHPLSPTHIDHCQHISNNNNNNNISDLKTNLAAKRTISTTSSPAVSPITKTPPPPASPTIVLAQQTNVNNIGSSTSSYSAKSTTNSDKLTRRIKPITVLKNSDEAWLKRQQQLQVPSSPIRVEECTVNSKLNTTPPSAVKSATLMFDLTDTQEKISSIITLDDSPTSTHKTFAKRSSSDSITEVKLNGNRNITSGISIVHKIAETDTTPSISKNNNNNEQQQPLPIEEDFEELIKTCRKADDSADMEKLIVTKLIRYYNEVHPSFIHSRGFRKNVRAVTAMIKSNPDLVYYNLKTIVDELKVRRKVKVVESIATNEDETNSNSNSNGSGSVSNIASTGNKRTDEQIRKLNKALYILNKRIIKLEEAEVDWEDDDSTYVQMERFKKRACQIYEKICDLTGESKNAHRLAKKPISFTGTAIPQFNRTLQAYINRTREFPDYFDVLRMLEHCNRQYDLTLVNFEMKNIAQDAFLKVGKLLQARRRNDLYETVTHFTANTKDPATMDAELMSKLSENVKRQTKVSDIINKYANLTAEELKEEEDARIAQKSEEQSSETTIENGNDDDDDGDDDDDDDDEDTLDDDVEHWTNDVGVCNVELSDVEDDYTEFDGKESPSSDVKDEQARNAEKDNIVTQSAASDKTDIFLTTTTNTNITTTTHQSTDTSLTTRTNIQTTKTATTTPAALSNIKKTAESMATGTRKACDSISSKSLMRPKTGNDNKPPQQNGKLKEQHPTDATPNLRIVSVTSLQVHGDSSISGSRPKAVEVARNAPNVVKIVKNPVVLAQRSTMVKCAPSTTSTTSTTSYSTTTIAAKKSTTIDTIATKPTVTAKASSTKDAHKQRTVEEIVISDEES